MNKKWSDYELTYIKDNAKDKTDLQISIELTKMSNRLISRDAVRKQRQRLGIKKKHGRGICKLASDK